MRRKKREDGAILSAGKAAVRALSVRHGKRSDQTDVQLLFHAVRAFLHFFDGLTRHRFTPIRQV